MPTFPKAIAATYFAALGFFCASLVIPLLPEGSNPGNLGPVLAIVGMLSGWMMSGKRAGRGTRSGLGYGLTSAALIVAWGVILFAGYEMFQQSIKKRFDGAIDALQGMVTIGLDYLVLIAVPEIALALIVGGLFGGWLTEWAAKRWT